MKHKRSIVSRRAAIQIIAVAGIAAVEASPALADTSSDLASAQARLSEAQGELDAIASDYEALSTKQSQTLDQIEQVEHDIYKLERRIERTQRRLAAKQDDLSNTVSEEYKDGSAGVVDLLLRSKSVEDLISNLYYYGKVTEQQASLIQDVKDMRQAYLDDMCELEVQQVALEEASQAQQEQLEDMRDMQLQAQQVIDSLDKEVKDLIAKRDAELLAAQQEAERARKEREEAAAKAAAEEERRRKAEEQTQKEAQDAADEADSVGNDEVPASEDAETSATTSGTGSAAKVVAACKSTPSPGLGLCAGWCSNVMINAGYGFVPGNANDMYANFCHSSNRADLKPGMAVAVSTHPHTSAGRIYGHIGMYIGNGTMMDNIGYIRTISVDEWCEFYGETVAPRWGWLNGIVLE